VFDSPEREAIVLAETFIQMTGIIKILPAALHQIDIFNLIVCTQR
jgi:hypothetical protein